MLRICTVVQLFLFFMSGLQAQDVHFTRFYDAPLTLNPAKSGDYLGTFRLGGIIRDQNYNYSHLFVTPSVYLDAPIIKGFRATHWVGAGLTYLQDQAGKAGLKNSDFQLSAAYHIGLDKKMQSSIAIGASYGIAARSVSDKSKLIFGEFFTNGTNADLENITDEKVQYKNVNAGVQYTRLIAESGQMQLGFSLNHINRPRVGVLQAAGFRLPMRFNIYGTADFPFNDKIDILPAIYFSSMAGQRDLAVQAMGGLKMNPLKNERITAGLGFRAGDALQILAGYEVKTLKVGLAYDVTLNPIRPSCGFEISVSNIFMLYKKPKDNPVILCPRL